MAAEEQNQSVAEQEQPGPAEWKQKARFRYSPSGALLIRYTDVDEPASWQAPEPMAADPSYYNPLPQGPSPYHTAAAVATNFCQQCNRQFASLSGVLQHLRDNTNHKDTLEAAEAAFLIQCQEDGYWTGIGTQQWSDYDSTTNPGLMWGGSDYLAFGYGEDGSIMATPSDIYTPSDAGTGDDANGYAQQLETPARGGGGGSSSAYHTPSTLKGQGRPARATRGKTHRGNQGYKGPAPDICDESAFPPLAGSTPSSPAPPTPRPWVPPRSRPLRAEAQEYRPVTPVTPPTGSATPSLEASDAATIVTDKPTNDNTTTNDTTATDEVSVDVQTDVPTDASVVTETVKVVAEAAASEESTAGAVAKEGEAASAPESPTVSTPAAEAAAEAVKAQEVKHASLNADAPEWAPSA